MTDGLGAARIERILTILSHVYGVLHMKPPNVIAALSIVGQAAEEIEEWKEEAHDATD